ncbi:MAG: cysteine peptidase family C39 domain-containing protein, partial [Bacteroidota bacterium]
MTFHHFPFYKQLDQKDCGPTCIKIIAKHYGKVVPIELLRTRANITREGVSIADISEAAESIGFHPLAVKVDFETLEREVPLPCIAHWRNRHFVVVYRIKDNKIYVSDPAHGLLTYTLQDFLQGWAGQFSEGYLLTMEPTPAFYEAQSDQRPEFGFRFLVGYFRPHKRYIFQLFLGLALGSLLQLIFPFLTQSVVDYGINYENINFIYLVLLAQIVLFLSQSTVELIRGWILLHMTGRINISLISDFLLKMMRLPIAFFDSKNTGDIMQRI